MPRSIRAVLKLKPSRLPDIKILDLISAKSTIHYMPPLGNESPQFQVVMNDVMALSFKKNAKYSYF